MDFKDLIIAVDFDGTCVTHEYPQIGRSIGAEPVLRELVAGGAKIILWTMRDGLELEAAIAWFKDNGIELWGVNKNPTQASWTNSPKAFAQIYIDDAGLGIPLMLSVGVRPFVDWVHVRMLLFHQFQRNDIKILHAAANAN